MDRLDQIQPADAVSLLDITDMSQLRAIFESRVYNLKHRTVYFPIRHHSPACAHHLQRVIGEYKPDLILIEGPESGNSLIAVLTDEKTLPPVSLYYTYEDDHGREACYYPMLRYSPEYVALKEAQRLEIPAQFIDLDYRHVSRRAGSPAEQEQKENPTADAEFNCSKPLPSSFPKTTG